MTRVAWRPVRRTGRPPLDDDDPSVAVNVRMPSRTYDLLCERAQHERVSPPEGHCGGRALDRELREGEKK